jgi:hypothetical protein
MEGNYIRGRWVGDYDEDEDAVHSLEIQAELVEIIQKCCFTED